MAKTRKKSEKADKGTEEKTEGEKEFCGKENCDKEVEEDSVQCFACQKWFHSECTELQDEEIEVLSNNQIKWFCKCCIKKVTPVELLAEDEMIVELKEENIALKAKVQDTKAGKNGSIQEMQDKIVEKMTTKMTEMETRFTAKLENLSEKVEKVQVDKVNIQSWSQTVRDGNKEEVGPMLKDIMVEAMNKTKKDEFDQQQRAKNIVIYNIDESKAKKNEDKRKDDETLFSQICETIDITYLEDNDVTKITRIGEKKDDNVRPLLVCFSEQIHKESFMENLKKLKGTDFKSISVRHDMNRTEREITRNLAKEADAKNSQRSEEEKKSFIFRVRGPPGYQIIKKIIIKQTRGEY